MAAFKYLVTLVKKDIFSEKTAARTGKNIGENDKQRRGGIQHAGYAGMQRLKQGSSALLFTHQHIFPSLLANVLEFFLQVRLYHGKTRKFKAVLKAFILMTL